MAKAAIAHRPHVELSEAELKERWDKKREHIGTLSTSMRSLRNNLTRALKSDDEKERLTALIISVMDHTSERVGNGISADNGHFGITGLLKSHIKIKANTVTLDYCGKSGVQHEKSFSDALVAKELKKAIRKTPTDEVFTMADGLKLKEEQVNRFLKPYGVSAKDIRGFSANEYVLDRLKKEEPAEDEKKRKRQFNAAAKYAAGKVGHGAATLKKHYLLPELMEEFVNNGKLINLDQFAPGGEIGPASDSEKKAIKTAPHFPNNISLGFYHHSDGGVSVVDRHREMSKRDLAHISEDGTTITYQDKDLPKTVIQEIENEAEKQKEIIKKWGSSTSYLNNHKVNGGPFDDSENHSNFTSHEIRNIIQGIGQVARTAAIQAALLHLKGNARAGSEGEAENSWQNEGQRLENYISENNLWFVDGNLIPLKIGSGTEHKVFRFSEDTVLKINDHTRYYRSWQDYFISLLIHNNIFPKTAYELIGFTKRDDVLNAVVTQTFIDANQDTDIGEVEKFLTENNFVRLNDTDYVNSELGIRLNDLHYENVLTKDDILYFVDTVFYLADDYAGMPEFGTGGGVNEKTTIKAVEGKLPNRVFNDGFEEAVSKPMLRSPVKSKDREILQEGGSLSDKEYEKIIYSHDFRMYFGDWHREGFLNRLFSLQPNIEIQARERPPHKEEMDLLPRTLRKITTAINKKRIYIGKNTYGKILHHGERDEIFYSLYFLDEFCKNAIPFDIEPNSDENDTNTEFYECYFATAMLKGEKYLVRLSVQVGRAKRRRNEERERVLHDINIIKEKPFTIAVKDTLSSRALGEGFEIKDRKIDLLFQTLPQNISTNRLENGYPPREVAYEFSIKYPKSVRFTEKDVEKLTNSLNFYGVRKPTNLTIYEAKSRKAVGFWHGENDELVIKSGVFVNYILIKWLKDNGYFSEDTYPKIFAKGGKPGQNIDVAVGGFDFQVELNTHGTWVANSVKNGKPFIFNIVTGKTKLECIEKLKERVRESDPGFFHAEPEQKSVATEITKSIQFPAPLLLSGISFLHTVVSDIHWDRSKLMNWAHYQEIKVEPALAELRKAYNNAKGKGQKPVKDALKTEMESMETLRGSINDAALMEIERQQESVQETIVEYLKENKLIPAPFEDNLSDLMSGFWMAIFDRPGTEQYWDRTAEFVLLDIINDFNYNQELKLNKDYSPPLAVSEVTGQELPAPVVPMVDYLLGRTKEAKLIYAKYQTADTYGFLPAWQIAISTPPATQLLDQHEINIIFDTMVFVKKIADKPPVIPKVTITKAANDDLQVLAVKKYQWQRNKEGGQKYGNQEIIVPVDEAIWTKYVKPLTRYRSFKADQTANGPMFSSFVRHDNQGDWKQMFIKEWEEILPTEQNFNDGWVIEVDDFGSQAAIAQGSSADSEPKLVKDTVWVLVLPYKVGPGDISQATAWFTNVRNKLIDYRLQLNAMIIRMLDAEQQLFKETGSRDDAYVVSYNPELFIAFHQSARNIAKCTGQTLYTMDLPAQDKKSYLFFSPKTGPSVDYVLIPEDKFETLNCEEIKTLKLDTDGVVSSPFHPVFTPPASDPHAQFEEKLDALLNIIQSDSGFIHYYTAADDAVAPYRIDASTNYTKDQIKYFFETQEEGTKYKATVKTNNYAFDSDDSDVDVVFTKERYYFRKGKGEFVNFEWDEHAKPEKPGKVSRLQGSAGRYLMFGEDGAIIAQPFKTRDEAEKYAAKEGYRTKKYFDDKGLTPAELTKHILDIDDVIIFSPVSPYKWKEKSARKPKNLRKHDRWPGSETTREQFIEDSKNIDLQPIIDYIGKIARGESGVELTQGERTKIFELYSTLQNAGDKNEKAGLLYDAFDQDENQKLIGPQLFWENEREKLKNPRNVEKKSKTVEKTTLEEVISEKPKGRKSVLRKGLELAKSSQVTRFEYFRGGRSNSKMYNAVRVRAKGKPSEDFEIFEDYDQIQERAYQLNNALLTPAQREQVEAYRKLFVEAFKYFEEFNANSGKNYTLVDEGYDYAIPKVQKAHNLTDEQATWMKANIIYMGEGIPADPKSFTTHMIEKFVLGEVPALDLSANLPQIKVNTATPIEEEYKPLPESAEALFVEGLVETNRNTSVDPSAPGRYVLYTNEFGNDIYIADTSKSSDMLITPEKDEALVYSDADYKSTEAVKFWRNVTGYKKLEAIPLNSNVTDMLSDQGPAIADDAAAVVPFDYGKLFEAPTETAITKSVEDDREEAYQNSGFSKKWASTYKEALAKLTGQYQTAEKNKKEWEAKEYKPNKTVVEVGSAHTDFGPSMSIGAINESKRQKKIAAFSSEMKEAVEDMKGLGLTDEEIENIVPPFVDLTKEGIVVEIPAFLPFPDKDASVAISLLSNADEMFKEGYRYDVSVSYPESLGEMGNYSNNNLFKEKPTLEELRTLIDETIQQEISNFEESGTHSARDENIYAALKKIKSLT